MWIEPLKNGKFRACERYIDPLTDKPKKISVTIEKDTRAARRAAESVLHDKIEARQNTNPMDSVTLSELKEKYVAWQKKKLKTSSFPQTISYTDMIIDILGGDAKVSRLTAGIVTKAFQSHEMSDYTYNRVVLYFKAMLAWGYDHDLVESKMWLDKIKRISIPKKPTAEGKYLESDELKTLIDLFADREHWQLAIKFLVLSGLRIGEMIALLDSDIDDAGIHVTKTYHTGTFTFQDTPKTFSSIRTVYIQPELAVVIKQIRLYRKRVMIRTGVRTDRFFPNYDGRLFSYDGFQKQLVKMSVGKIGKRVTPHMLRHTHVSLLAEQGVSLDAISRRLGHSGTEMTRLIYLHVTKKRKEQDNQTIAAVKIL